MHRQQTTDESSRKSTDKTYALALPKADANSLVIQEQSIPFDIIYNIVLMLGNNSFFNLSVLAQVNKAFYRYSMSIYKQLLRDATLTEQINTQCMNVKRAEELCDQGRFGFCLIGYDNLKDAKNSDTFALYYLTQRIDNNEFELWYCESGCSQKTQVFFIEKNVLKELVDSYPDFMSGGIPHWLFPSEEYVTLSNSDETQMMMPLFINEIKKHHVAKPKVYTRPDEKGDYSLNQFFNQKIQSKFGVRNSMCVTYQHKNQPEKIILLIKNEENMDNEDSAEEANLYKGKLIDFLKSRYVTHYLSDSVQSISFPFFMRADKFLFSEHKLMPRERNSIPGAIDLMSFAVQISQLLGPDRAKEIDALPFIHEIKCEADVMSAVLSFKGEGFPRDLVSALNEYKHAMLHIDEDKFSAADTKFCEYTDTGEYTQQFVMLSSIKVVGRSAIQALLQLCGYQDQNIEVFLDQAQARAQATTTATTMPTVSTATPNMG